MVFSLCVTCSNQFVLTFRAQNESLKQEIVSQEVELKSQISVLEKKAHESWVTARQAERKLEDARQEASQLRNRLTLKERTFTDDKNQNRKNKSTIHGTFSLYFIFQDCCQV